MDSLPSLKKNWIITQEALNKLLASLDPDRQVAAEKYENIRQRLITFFECRGCCSPEDYTDITINRVARKIIEGKEIYTSDPSSFFFGVARKVLQEYWDEVIKEPTPLENLSSLKYLSQYPDKIEERNLERRKFEQEMECLERCLNTLSAKHRDLILRYYDGEEGIKVKNRRNLAEQLKIPINALRIRAMRIRERLESCIANCLNELRDI